MSLLQEWKIRRAQAAAQRMIDERDAAHYPPSRYDPLHRQTDFDPPGAPNKE